MDQTEAALHEDEAGSHDGDGAVPLARASGRRVEKALDVLASVLEEVVEDMDACGMDTREARRIDMTHLRGLPPPALMKALEALYDGAFGNLGMQENDRSIPITTRAPLLHDSIDLVMAWLEAVISLGEHIRILRLR